MPQTFLLRHQLSGEHMNDLDFSNYLRANFKLTMQAKNRRTLVCGVGINDADYVPSPTVGGGGLRCPAYHRWTLMIERCYSRHYVERNPTYLDVTVCDEWKRFMGFRAWWAANQVDGWDIDKDILVPGNKTYSPDACIFVPRLINCFIADNAADRGPWPIGVSYEMDRGKFRSYCCNPLTGRCEKIGRHDDPLSANHAYVDRKLEHANAIRHISDSIDRRIHPRLVEIIEGRRLPR